MVKLIIRFFIILPFFLFSNCILSLISIPGCLHPIDNIKTKDYGYLKAEKTAIAFFKAISDSDIVKAYGMTTKDSSFGYFQNYAARMRCIQKTSKNLKFHAFLGGYEMADSIGLPFKKYKYYCFFYSYKSKGGFQGSNYYSKINAIRIPKGDSLIDKVEFGLSFCCP